MAADQSNARSNTPTVTNEGSPLPEPRGFGPHSRGLAGEYAHEQGWGLEEEQRTRLPEGLQDIDGGANYEYGARDFGDEPTNTKRFRTSPGTPEQEPDSTRAGE